MNLVNSRNLWQAQNLPEGLTLRDGIISGNPNVRGTFDVPVTVSNSLGSSTKYIRIKTRYRDDVIILQNGQEFELITPSELQKAIQDGTAVNKYNCINTQMLIPFTHPLTGDIIDNMPLNFCSFRNVTLQDGSVKQALILQFAKPLWKGFAPFSTNGFNRWKYSQLRKWLNSSGKNWFSQDYQNDILTPHDASYSDSGVNGFLSCLPYSLRNVLLPVKLITQAFFDDYNDDPAIDDPDYIDGHDADITYDMVFIPSLSEMGISSTSDSHFPDSSFEGSAWEFYSALNNGYSISSDINDVPCFITSRSAYLNGTNKVIYVNSSLEPVVNYAYYSDAAVAPAFAIA